MKSLLNPTRSFFSGQLLSHFAWLATAGALFPAAACSDAGLDVGNDSRGVNSHEDGATDDSSSESAAEESNGTPMETPAPDVSVEADDEMPEPGNPGLTPTPMEPGANPNPVESPGLTPTPTPTELGANPNPMEVAMPTPRPTPAAPTSPCLAGDANYTLCAGECVDISSNPLNCGACGLACMAETCEQGVCGGTEPNPNPVSICGDGLLDMASESCDDGNTASNDGCSAMCTLEEAFLCPNGEYCTSECGDGIIEAQEICDDGNLESGDGCDAACDIEAGFSCTLVAGTPIMPLGDGGSPPPSSMSQCDPICGDGVVVGDEECDPGMAPNETCTLDCTLPI